eukprot:1296703-Rhodomonas_salina.1
MRFAGSGTDVVCTSALRPYWRRVCCYGACGTDIMYPLRQAGLLYTLVSHAARNGSAGYITTRKITDEGLTVVRSAKVVPNAATALGTTRLLS